MCVCVVLKLCVPYEVQFLLFCLQSQTEPDHVGNINSPVASVFDSASFVSALVELALNAEVVRARSQIVTQPVPKQGGNQVLDPANLFFDSESRAIQSQATGEEGETNAFNLSVAARACEVINRMQTTVQDAIGGKEMASPTCRQRSRPASSPSRRSSRWSPTSALRREGPTSWS